MTAVPTAPKIYHITHVSNLASIVASGGLLSDAQLAQQPGAAPSVIGMARLKQRRFSLPVSCHLGDCVADYVPFYFCARSVMLYLIHRGNHPDVAFQGGQEGVVHLEAALDDVVAWAGQQDVRWAISLSNASSTYAEFRSDIQGLGELDWSAITATQWSGRQEAKQAEFLVHTGFPWDLFRRIGVHSRPVAQEVGRILTSAPHRPVVEVKRDWYY